MSLIAFRTGITGPCRQTGSLCILCCVRFWSKPVRDSLLPNRPSDLIAVLRLIPGYIPWTSPFLRVRLLRRRLGLVDHSPKSEQPAVKGPNPATQSAVKKRNRNEPGDAASRFQPEEWRTRS
jgi:hypothetical protein